jgi:hypothetical protein
MNCGGLTSCCASVGASKNVYASPACRCHSMWQWKNQVPGLSVRIRMVTEPPGGTCTVSRHIGLVSPSCIGGLIVGSSEVTSQDLCTMANLCPCKWLSNRISTVKKLRKGATHNGCFPASQFITVKSKVLLNSRISAFGP